MPSCRETVQQARARFAAISKPDAQRSGARACRMQHIRCRRRPSSLHLRRPAVCARAPSTQPASLHTWARAVAGGKHAVKAKQALRCEAHQGGAHGSDSALHWRYPRVGLQWVNAAAHPPAFAVVSSAKPASPHPSIPALTTPLPRRHHTTTCLAAPCSRGAALAPRTHGRKQRWTSACPPAPAPPSAQSCCSRTSCRAAPGRRGGRRCWRLHGAGVGKSARQHGAPRAGRPPAACRA